MAEDIMQLIISLALLVIFLGFMGAVVQILTGYDCPVTQADYDYCIEANKGLVESLDVIPELNKVIEEKEIIINQSKTEYLELEKVCDPSPNFFKGDIQIFNKEMKAWIFYMIPILLMFGINLTLFKLETKVEVHFHGLNKTEISWIKFSFTLLSFVVSYPITMGIIYLFL